VKILFLGTSEFAALSLEALAAEYDIVGVVSQPDRARTRKGEQISTPVKVCAERLGLRLFQFADINKPENLALLASLKADIAAVVAFGQKLSPEFLALAGQGAFNLHGSLLPEYRGAAPINCAIAGGLTKTGLTIFKISPQWDSGAICAKMEISIGPDETFGELSERMAQLGAGFFKKAVRDIAAGCVKPCRQDHQKATYAPKIHKCEGLLRWEGDFQAVYNQFRSVTPKPGAFTYMRVGQKPLRIKILEARPVASAHGEPGISLTADPDNLVIGCGTGGLRIIRLQAEGKRAMSVREFTNGHPIEPGRQFGPEVL